MIKHIYPLKDNKNGVYVYGKYLDRLIKNMPPIKGKEIIHFELGYTGQRELWLLNKEMNENKNAKFVITLHDPPIVVGKPFNQYIASKNLASRLLRKFLDKTYGRYIIKKLLKKADILLLINKKSETVASKYYDIERSHFRYLPLPVMMKERKKSVKNEYRSDILFFGNIDKRKGLDILLNACSLNASYSKYKIKIIGSSSGDKEYSKKIKKIVDDKKLQNVEFKGFVPDDELLEYIYNTKVVVLPYRDYGIFHASGPMFIAMKFGVPVIASDIPTFSAYIKNGLNGLLFEEGNVKDLANKIKTILKDKKIYISISKNSKQYVELNNSDKLILEKLKKVYEEV